MLSDDGGSTNHRYPGQDDGGDFPYLASFANEQTFLSRQGVALLLLATAGIIEFAPTGGVAAAGHAIAGFLVVVASVTIAVALCRFTKAEHRIRDDYRGSAE